MVPPNLPLQYFHPNVIKVIGPAFIVEGLNIEAGLELLNCRIPTMGPVPNDAQS